MLKVTVLASSTIVPHMAVTRGTRTMKHYWFGITMTFLFSNTIWKSMMRISHFEYQQGMRI